MDAGFFSSDRFKNTKGIIAVLVIEEVELAVELSEALLAGGVRCMELALRTPCAVDCLAAIRQKTPDMVAGVGTVLFPEQLEEIVEAGAEFCVSPGMNPTVLEKAIQLGMPFAPGIATPSDIEMALRYGTRVMKFFPSEPMGGLQYLESMSAPYRHLGLRFIPLGGINAGNCKAYLENPLVIGIGGTWIAKPDMIHARDWAGITKNARDVMALADSLDAGKRRA